MRARGTFDLTDVEATGRREQHLERVARVAIAGVARAFARGYVAALTDPKAEDWLDFYREKVR